MWIWLGVFEKELNSQLKACYVNNTKSFELCSRSIKAILDDIKLCIQALYEISQSRIDM